MSIEKFALTEQDKQLIAPWINGTGFKAEVAKNVMKCGKISEKQRKVFISAPVTHTGNHQQDDYDESDYEIGAYELCVGEYGD